MKNIEANEKGFPCVESMTKLFVGHYTVRVWRDESHACDVYDNSDLRDFSDRAATAAWGQAKIAREFAKLPRVSAVEVLDGLGNGVVVYTEWP